MKVALCFIISYDHILNKEEIWKEWIEPNKDIINVYFYYKDLSKIKSEWILQHTVPPAYIIDTSYYHVIPAYLSVMKFALSHDARNSWCCMLTDSCCPIISPSNFRRLFYSHYEKSIMSWKKPWWNIDIHNRANLKMLPPELQLANDPWFVLQRENIKHILTFVNKQPAATKTICDGKLANESLFAIILHGYKQLEPTGRVISAVTHITDWNRMTTTTSPHVFKDANKTDLQFIESESKKNKYAMFIRKIAPEFPNDVLRHYIYKVNHDNRPIWKPLVFIYNDIVSDLKRFLPVILLACIGYMCYINSNDR